VGSNPISFFPSWEASVGEVHRVCVCVLVLYILGSCLYSCTTHSGGHVHVLGVVFVFLYFTFRGSCLCSCTSHSGGCVCVLVLHIPGVVFVFLYFTFRGLCLCSCTSHSGVQHNNMVYSRTWFAPLICMSCTPSIEWNFAWLHQLKSLQVVRSGPFNMSYWWPMVLSPSLTCVRAGECECVFFIWGFTNSCGQVWVCLLHLRIYKLGCLQLGLRTGDFHLVHKVLNMIPKNRSLSDVIVYSCFLSLLLHLHMRHRIFQLQY
jgi:hypothetical protein